MLHKEKSGLGYSEIILFYDDIWRKDAGRKVQVNKNIPPHRPWLLTAVFEYGGDRKAAMATERFIKKQKSHRLI
ncbi:hypothetical protein FW774_14080 [Pedobacter sp. BS3]|uniref:hypothetical protein n=1 Tax=Pedobacter sp. BS3 TaxID=2567937 RepID=UPI0011EE7754|nr:hypothetical protein [Pedobacter sp. BS3]TZF82630.1 hypothetical protein FW774_14080 [Pedobacter sp. BS3]